MDSMTIRPYHSEDCGELARLFYETVHTVNAADYTPEQLDAWATGKKPLDTWDRSFRANTTLVAESGGQIVGFADMDDSGYLDHLFVHRDFQRRGVATALCEALEAGCSCLRYTTHASIMARPFFQSRGYRVVREQQVDCRGVLLTNFVMEKPGPQAPLLRKDEKG